MEYCSAGAAGRVAAADLGATAYQTVSGYFIQRDGGGGATAGAPATAQTWREWMHSWIPYGQSGQPPGDTGVTVCP